MDSQPAFGPWQAVEKLGEGGVCAVYRARHAVDGREVAIKVLSEITTENVGRFAHEARLLLQIDHPNVLAVLDAATEERPPWMVMELLAGDDLDVVRSRGPMDPEEAATLIARVADGLCAVHAMGVRHRDIKPANIMVGPDHSPKLIDFGIARKIHDTHQTRAGMVVGTAAYLPPEVWSAPDPQGAQDTEAADVYSLGQTLCELLTGQPVYEREGDTTLLVAIMRDKLERDALDPRQWRPDVPADLARLVVTATAREPQDRIGTAEELRLRLDQYVAARHDPPPPPGPGTGPIRRPSGNTGLAWTAGAGLLAIAVLFAGTLGGLFALWTARPQVPPPADPAAIHTALLSQRDALAGCASGKPARVTVTWVVHGGRTWHARVDAATADEASTACVLGALGTLAWPEGSLAVTAPIELR